MSIVPTAIDSKDTPNSIASRWNVNANEYTIDGKTVDLQDLMVHVSKNRAVVVEGEVAPLSLRIKSRNSDLNELGGALSAYTEAQNSFDKDAEPDTPANVNLTQEQVNILTKYGIKKSDGSALTAGNNSITKSRIEGDIQRIKSSIDGENNASQMDMSRLQQLVDRRDESYSTATNLMSSISETRGNLIRNL